jgi:hypothetical protein
MAGLAGLLHQGFEQAAARRHGHCGVQGVEGESAETMADDQPLARRFAHEKALAEKPFDQPIHRGPRQGELVDQIGNRRRCRRGGDRLQQGERAREDPGLRIARESRGRECDRGRRKRLLIVHFPILQDFSIVSPIVNIELFPRFQMDRAARRAMRSSLLASSAYGFSASETSFGRSQARVLNHLHFIRLLPAEYDSGRSEPGSSRADIGIHAAWCRSNIR